MNDSNRTLMFSRTSREAYGYWIRLQPDHHWAEPILWALSVFGFGMLFGLWLFG